jgi:hypothetical protein
VACCASSSTLLCASETEVGVGRGRRQHGNDVPGFVNVLNLLYTVYEIVEFGARLAQ